MTVRYTEIEATCDGDECETEATGSVQELLDGGWYIDASDGTYEGAKCLCPDCNTENSDDDGEDCT